MSVTLLETVGTISVVEEAGGVSLIEVSGTPGPPGATGATGPAGPNEISDSTTLGTLTAIANPLFLLASDVGPTPGLVRRLTPGATGLSLLLAADTAAALTALPGVGVPAYDAGDIGLVLSVVDAGGGVPGTDWVAQTGGGGGGAPTGASYVTLSVDATLTAERVLTAGAGVSLTDGGANSTATIANSDRGSTAVAGHVAEADPHPQYARTAAENSFTAVQHIRPAADTVHALTLQSNEDGAPLLRGLDNSEATVLEVSGAGGVTATSFSGSGAGLTDIPQSGVTGLTADLALKAPLASPTFAGSLTVTEVVRARVDEFDNPVLEIWEPSNVQYVLAIRAGDGELYLGDGQIVIASVFQGSGSGLTGVPQSGVTGLTADLAGKQPLDADLTSWAGVTRAAGFDTFAATPTSANLAALLTDETGTGAAYFVGGALGTPASATLTNATGLPIVAGTTGTLSVARGGTGATDAAGARTALGLGDVATRNVGTTAGTAAAGDDARFTDSRTPTGSAGGDLTGSYPNPTLNTVTVAKGGTGATTAVSARANLGFITLTTTATTGTVTLDLSAADITFVLSLTNNVTLALSNEADGRRFTLFVRGQASGFTVTWFAGVKWSGGAAPTIPTVSGRVLPISFIRLASGEWLGIPGQECY